MKQRNWLEMLIDRIKEYFKDRRRAKWLLMAHCEECMGEFYPYAHDTGDGWLLGVTCDTGCHEGININWWFPDKRETATAQDFIKLGFIIE